jgi:hypothetical protein
LTGGGDGRGVDVLDVAAPGVERFDFGLVGVDAIDLGAGFGKLHGQRKTHVAHADDGEVHKEAISKKWRVAVYDAGGSQMVVQYFVVSDISWQSSVGWRRHFLPVTFDAPRWAMPDYCPFLARTTRMVWRRITTSSQMERFLM